MLDDFGLHQLIWNLADQVVSDILVASPMDARGRGIALDVRENGVVADLGGATAYLVWTHRGTGKRGATAFEAVDASAGKFSVYYPAAMCTAGGIVDASVMLSLGDGRYLSTRDFNIRVERVLVDGLEPEDGFTLFVQAIAAYENAGDISTDAATAANAAADAANAAAGNAAQAIADLRAAAAAGDFDGADGFSPVAVVTQNATGGATITITDKNGTTSADISKGAQGEKGDKGDTGEQGPKGDTGDTGPQGIQGETGPQGEKGDTGATGAQGPKGETGDTGSLGPKGDTGETGATGAQGPQGETGPKGDTGATGPQGERGEKGETGERGPQGVQGETGPAGAKGDKGDDGVSCTHAWNGTV
ncbi:MAG: BppU family phage baseplate upper protein, partial [Eggerthellaceae bacterium]|nr:BppU family phage baseplate upper protein [Eggerthellaceae bacterium]